jgi:glycosyltransferase involved in cell wall biosynthesis
VIWHLAHGLRARGHEARILVPRAARGLPPESEIAGVVVTRYDDPRHSFLDLYLSSLGAARRAIGRSLRAFRPDVVHAHHALSGLAARWAGVAPYYTFHGPWHLEFLLEAADRPGRRRWTRRLWMPVKAEYARRVEGAAVRRSERIVVLSAYSRRLLGEIHGVGAPRVVVVPGGVDLDRFRPAGDRRAIRDSLGLPPGPLLFTVRRLVPRMGLDRLLGALVEIPGAFLVIAGSGWLGPALESTAAALGVSARVRFAGFVSDEDLPRYYQAADLVVLPSVALEGFGLITLEALACGTPVVATGDSGAVDVLQPLEPSWIAADGSPRAIATTVRGALAEVAGDGETRARCRAHAAGYSWDRMAATHEALYAARAR